MQEKENLEKNNEKFSKIEKEGKIIDSTNKENEYAENKQSGKSRNKKQKGLQLNQLHMMERMQY